MGEAVGMLEVFGLATAYAAADAGCKAGNVRLETFDKNKPANAKDAMAAGVHDGDIVSVKADNERGTVFNHVQIRVDDSFTLEMHIDTDEANASKIATGDTVRIIC